jgi:hypothetical protein
MRGIALLVDSHTHHSVIPVCSNATTSPCRPILCEVRHMTDDPNRRRSPRYSHRIRVQAWTGSVSLDGWTENVSAEGLYFKCARPLPLGQPLALKVFLQDAPLLEVTAVVARVVAPSMTEPDAVGVGTQFATMSNEARSRWLRYLQPLAPTTSSVSFPAVSIPAVHVPTAPQPPLAAAAPPVARSPGPPPMPPGAGETGTLLGALMVEVRPGQNHALLDQFTLDLASGTLRIRGLPALPVGTQLMVRVVHPDGAATVELPGKVTSAAGSNLVVSVVVPQAHRPALTAFVYPRQ